MNSREDELFSCVTLPAGEDGPIPNLLLLSWCRLTSGIRRPYSESQGIGVLPPAGSRLTSPSHHWGDFSGIYCKLSEQEREGVRVRFICPYIMIYRLLEGKVRTEGLFQVVKEML